MRTQRNLIERWLPYDGQGHEWPQACAIIAATLGFFSSTSLSAWTSPSIPILISHSSHLEPMTMEEVSYLTIIVPIAAVIISPIFALLVDTVGRKKSVMLMTGLYFLSWMLIAFADSLPVFYLSRFLEGSADAAVFTVVPVYIAEIAEPKLRVTWGNTVAFFVFLGQFVVNVLGTFYDIRTSALILGVVPLLQFFLMVIMPDSPYFLIAKGRDEDARRSLKRLRWMENVENELRSLTKDLQRQTEESGTFIDLFTITTNRKALLIAVGSRAVQQFSGIAVFFMYTQYIFNRAASDISASMSAIIFTGMFWVTATGFALIIGRFGRKPLMTFSCLGCGVVMAAEAVYFYIKDHTLLDVSNLTWIPLAGMMAYVPASSAGLSIIPTLLSGELFSASVKGKAMCMLNICFSIFVFAALKLFQILSEYFGMYAPFCLFALCCFLGVAFSYCFMPETRGKTLEEIQRSLQGRKFVSKDAVINSFVHC